MVFKTKIAKSMEKHLKVYLILLIFAIISTGILPALYLIPTLKPGTSSYIDTTGHSQGVFVSGNYAYMGVGSKGLVIINISNPLNPEDPK